MEAKRRRLEGPSGQSLGQGKTVKVTRQMLTSENEKTRLEAVQELKKQITNKTAVKTFMNENDPEQLFKAVMDMFVKKTTEFMESGSAQFPSELKFAIGILANCCFYTTEACLEMKQNHIRFNSLAVKIAESTLTPTDCKYSLMRLIGNMCAHKEAALSISTSSLLLEQIVKQLDSDHSLTVSQAMRCLGMLTNASLWRPVLQANVAFNLGKLIAAKSGKVVEDAVSLLLLLSRRNANEVGIQVTGSDCVEKLLELFFQGNETVQQLVVRLCGASPDVRDKFGEKGTIQKITDNEEHHTQECCNLLSTFAQDAWGRATLRTSGALDVLLNRLCKDCPLSEKMNLIRSLKHFIHDTAGIAHMAASRQFVDMVVKDVKEFVQENGSVCKPTVPDDDDFYRPDSPLLVEIETSMKEDTSRRDQPERLHKDFFSLWGYSASSPTRSMSSGNLSPHSSGAASPIWLTSPESASRLSLAGSYQKSEQPLDQDEADNSASENDRCRRAIVDSELWLICQQTQEDSNLPRLIRVDLIDAILDYLSMIPRPDYRVARALRRLAEFREGLDKMIEMEFHTRVLNKLCDTPCRILRNARRCNRCEKCGTFGREVLKEFASHVDSDFGHSYVSRLISSPDFDTRVRAAIAKVALIRNRGPMDRRLSIGHKNAMEILVDSLKDLITRENFEEIADEPTYSGGPPLCAQIVGALSTLIPLSKIREMFDIDAVFVRSELVECKISSECPENPNDYLKFEEDGRCLAYISLKDACENSGYFQGMFTANLLEKTSGQRVFKFDPEKENCSSDDFTRFLHWLSGCRDECTTRVKTISTCLAMIELSDRYLCHSLSDWVCGPHGPASRLISGSSLQHLFPAALSTNMHPRFLSACFATLMRYANAEDIVNVMLVIHKLPVLQETFLSKLRSFVTDCTR